MILIPPNLYIFLYLEIISSHMGKDIYSYAHMCGIMPRYGQRGGRGRMRHMRRIAYLPQVNFYRPQGVPIPELEIVIVTHEELEAIRLVDFLGLAQEEAANHMGISRKSMAGDLKSGRRKIADAILYGKAIRIEGGDFVFHRGNEIE